MSTTLKSDKFCKTDVNKNNNKYWYIFLYDDNTVETQFGRVGCSPQSSVKSCTSPSAAEKYYNKKIQEKERSRNGEIPYRRLNVIDGSSTTINVTGNSLEKIVEEQISTDGSSELKDLMKRLVSQNIHQITSNSNITVQNGVLSTPCGIVTKETVAEAKLKLQEMSAFILAKEFHDAKYHTLIGDYLMLVPQDFGRKLNPENMFTGQEDVLKQNALLDAMAAAVDNSVVVKTDEKVFDVKLSKVNDDVIIKGIEKFFFDTKNNIHSCRDLKPKQIFTVDISNMTNAFNGVANTIGNIKRLWHGTRVCNVLSILKGGLVIPPSNAGHCTGRMFGDGVYFSDQSTKSLNYSYGYWNGGSRDNNCYMFLADVAMGREYIPSSTYGRSNLPMNGYDSTFAKAGQSGVMNNEMIVYNTNQCKLTYLIEFSM